MNSKTIWKIITLIELAAIVAVVLLDLFMPTLVLIGLMVISLLIRREHIAVMGLSGHNPGWVWRVSPLSLL